MEGWKGRDYRGMNIIEIENLTYSYPAAETPILKDITLQVEKGDFLAIVGNNGCGKSTFCKTLNGRFPGRWWWTG